jgi:hypothetical protein
MRRGFQPASGTPLAHFALDTLRCPTPGPTTGSSRCALRIDDPMAQPYRNVFGRLVTACCLIALAFPARADAAFSLVFSKTSGSPGDAIHVKTRGEGSLAALVSVPKVRKAGLPTFLMPTPAARENLSTGDADLKNIGSLTVDADGNGKLTFEIPNVPSGEYNVVVLCEPCRSFNAGRAFLDGGPFDGAFVVESSTNPWFRGGLLGLLIASLVALSVIALWKRPFRPSRHQARILNGPAR